MAIAAPLPTVVARKRSGLWGVPVYWHLCSLDAPTVAVLWAWCLARALELRVSLISIAVLGIGTWLIYVADRLLDAHSPSHPALRERHFFHARHRSALLQIAAVAGSLLLGLICIMPTAARRDDALLFAFAMLYFASVHLPRLRVRRWFPREVAVGILFALATAVPAWATDASARAQLAEPVLLFAALCTLNCIAIETWERPAISTTSITVSAFALCLSAAALALALSQQRRESGIYTSTLASALLLFALHRLHRRFVHPKSNPENRMHFLLLLRVAADAVLLTPVLFVLPWHL